MPIFNILSMESTIVQNYIDTKDRSKHKSFKTCKKGMILKAIDTLSSEAIM